MALGCQEGVEAADNDDIAESGDTVTQPFCRLWVKIQVVRIVAWIVTSELTLTR